MDGKSFSDHELWDVVAACKEAAGNIDEEQAPGAPARVKAASELLERYRRHTDAPLYSTTMLDNMASAWSSLRSTVELAISNPPGYAASIDTRVDAIISQTSSWPPPWRANALSAAMQTKLDAFSMDADQRRENLAQRIHDLTSDLQEREDEIESLKQQTAELKTKLDEHAASIDTKFSSLSTTFDESQISRTTAFTDWLDKRKEELVAVRETNEEELTKYEAEAQATLQRLEELHTSAENVTSKVAAATMARDFGQFARNQMWAAVIALAVGAALLIWAGVELATTVRAAGPHASTSWQWVSLKLGLSATIIGGASVALTLGNKFLRNSTVAKRMDLELRAIGPYLADVDEQEAQTTKVAIANRAFGYVWTSENGTASEDEDRISVGAVAQLIEAATKVATK